MYIYMYIYIYILYVQCKLCSAYVTVLLLLSEFLYCHDFSAGIRFPFCIFYFIHFFIFFFFIFIFQLYNTAEVGRSECLSIRLFIILYNIYKRVIYKHSCMRISEVMTLCGRFFHYFYL